MNADIARKIISMPCAADLGRALELLGEQGKLTDLQPMLAFVKDASGSIGRAAVAACSNLIRNNLIAHFHELNPQVRQKLGTIMESLVPQIINEIGKDLYCTDGPAPVRGPNSRTA